MPFSALLLPTSTGKSLRDVCTAGAWTSFAAAGGCCARAPAELHAASAALAPKAAPRKSRRGRRDTSLTSSFGRGSVMTSPPRLESGLLALAVAGWSFRSLGQVQAQIADPR